jgi:hypothetical protein
MKKLKLTKKTTCSLESMANKKFSYFPSRNLDYLDIKRI